MKSITKQIVNRIRGNGRGWVFTPQDFLDLGSRAAIDQTLSRLAQADTIRRLKRGLYDYPKQHPRLGQLTPSPDAIANAIARKTGAAWQVSNARAANALGLTTQVPAKPIYFIHGTPQQVTIGQQTIDFRQGSARRMVGAGTTWGTALRALDYFGKDGINDDVIAQLADKLTAKDIAALRKSFYAIPDWKRNVINQI